MEKVMLIVFILIPKLFLGQDSTFIVGIYEGESWYKKDLDTNWTKSRRYFLVDKFAVNNDGCTAYFYYKYDLSDVDWKPLSLYGVFTTDIPGFCNDTVNKFSTDTKFHVENSFFINRENTVLGNPYRIVDYRYYGKKIVTGIEDKQNQNQNKLYPNPAQDYIILPEVATNESLDLYNSQGVKQETPNAISENGELQIDTSILENGLYLLKVNDRVYRFVKE